ncbi:GH32 C-terminal domain-containing protein [Clostridium sp.]|uniref:GH32 C-terminal domain-containing protein n=1 Tax=Clostridium sp. TaxID=1506 RepID=UPI0035230DD8
MNKVLNEGQVIPYSKNTQDQDLALGTGSVIKDNNGVFHAFYTGHNPKKMPKEAIMHATSMDMKEWTKISEDTFFADEQYSGDDFRDPYVIYNEDYNEYWMLITTRKNNSGVIALYTSDDLRVWKDQGILFKNDMGTDSNLECPTLIEYGEYWYLSFSDQWPDRVTHYRIASDSKGEFIIPQKDHFDGNGFYAGRMEKDLEHLYIFGWTPTKVMYSDSENYDWAGNLVVHQLKQDENGELHPVPIDNVIEKIKKDTKIKLIEYTKTINKNKNTYKFSGKNYEFAKFDAINGISKIKGKINLNSDSGKFGFMFNVDEDNLGSLNIVFDIDKQEIQFYNTSINNISNLQPQSNIPFEFNEKSSLDFTIIIDDSVVVIYVNDEIVLSSRMFLVQGSEWGIFSIDNDVIFENITLNK